MAHREHEELNANTASAAERDRVYGSGPAITRRIVEYREQNGRLTFAADLVRINGIDGAFMGNLLKHARFESSPARAGKVASAFPTEARVLFIDAGALPSQRERVQQLGGGARLPWARAG